MLPDSIPLKEIDETQAHYSHEEVQADGDIPLSKHRKLKWKLDFFILPLISSVYFFASMVYQQFLLFRCYSTHINLI